MNFLDYKNLDNFKKVIAKAQKNYIQLLGKPTDNDFITIINDYKLTRIAVILCISYADEKKEPVKEARNKIAYIKKDCIYNYMNNFELITNNYRVSLTGKSISKKMQQTKKKCVILQNVLVMTLESK